MEWLFEIVFEVLFTGLLDAAGSRRVPFPVRLLIVTVLLGALIALGIWGTVSSYKDGRIAGVVIFAVITLFLFSGWVAACFLIIKNRKPDKNSDLD